MEVHDVVTKLIGPIDPVGESTEDMQRFDNLKAMTDLANMILADIYRVTYGEGRAEASLNKAGKYAREQLASLAEYSDVD